MKNLLMITTLFFFSITTIAVVNSKPVLIKNENGYIQIFLNGRDTVSITEFNLDGEKNGVQQLFDERGVRRSKMNFSKNQKNGMSLFYNHFGVLYLKKEYSYGKCVATTNSVVKIFKKKKISIE